MFKHLSRWIIIYCISHSTLGHSSLCDTISSWLSCGGYSSRCCQSFDVEIGWRRDDLNWKVKDLHSSHISGKARDHIHFKDINSYAISGQAKWVASQYYVRLSAEYGSTYKGRAHEHFNIHSPLLLDRISVHTNSPIKRQSEVYDFDGAVGYPFTFFNCRLTFIPLIGFSWHRQHLRVKDSNDDTGSSSYQSYDSNSSAHSSSFIVSTDNPFFGFPSSDPFSSPSDRNIASVLGLSNPHETSNYRFTWYGFYLGADMAFALSNYWTIFWDTEFHFMDNCHRKRKSWTGVYFVDDYHKKGSAYGFNNSVGLNYYLCNSWYGTLIVDIDWWKTDSDDDTLHWRKVGAKAGFIYAF